jgi:hypothetical protein
MDEYMSALAAEVVQGCKAAGINLDYQPRTLPLVDKYLAANRQNREALAAPMAAYVGEVIRRETGGAWYEHQGEPALDVGEHQVDPRAAIASLFQNGSAQFGSVKVDTTKQYCEWVVRMQRQWLDQTLLGTCQTMAELRTSMTPDAKLAGALVAQAQAAVLTGKLKWQETLDFTPDSLDALERILSKIHNAVRFGSVEARPGADEVELMAKVWGLYAGEVIRRHYGGVWSVGEYGEYVLSTGEATLLPVVKMRKRIQEGPTENVRVYFTSVDRKLRSS